MTVFIHKGDMPLSVRQATKRGLRYFEAQKPQYVRETGIVTQDAEYQAWAAQWLADNVINAENNQFNHQLAAYRKALSEGDQAVIDATPQAVKDFHEAEENDTAGTP